MPAPGRRRSRRAGRRPYPARRGRAVGRVVRLDQLEPVLEAVGEALGEHRAVEDVLHRIADRAPFEALVEPPHELVVDVFVHDHRAERRAALARGAEAGEQRALDRQVEVGVVHHHERVLAAELEARRLEVAAAERADLGADGGGAGEADLVDEPCSSARSSPANVAAPSVWTRFSTPFGHAAGVEQLGDRRADRRAVLGRLPDDRVAAQDRRDEVPARAPRRGSCRR